MQYIFEYRAAQSATDENPYPMNARCVIRSDTYAKTIHHINNLMNQALADFPDLNPKDVEICHFGGQHYKRTRGIEFTPTGDIPERYQVIHQLENLL